MASPQPSTVVLVPGLSGSPDDFAFVRPMLARRGTAVTVDLSAEAGGLTFDAQVQHVRRTIDDVIDKHDEHGKEHHSAHEDDGAHPIVLVGSSFGALVATAVAAADPRVTGLVLLGGWLAPDDRLRDGLDHLLAVRERTPDLLDAVARLLLLSPSALSGATPPLLPAGELTARRLAWARSADLRHLHVAAPVLVVTGRADALVSPTLSQELVGTFDDVRHAELDAGHALLAERPAEVLSLVEAFVDGRLAQGPVQAAQV
jgi:pimeloyl-ACP methyl ester carboxylesterase